MRRAAAGRGAGIDLLRITVEGEMVCLPNQNDPDNELDDTRPVWSPGGSQIAYASERDGDFDIWVVNSDLSGTPENRTNDVDGDDEPDPTIPDDDPDWGPALLQ